MITPEWYGPVMWTGLIAVALFLAVCVWKDW